MLQLFDQTDRFDLERADSLMTNWRRWGELRKKRIMPPTLAEKRLDTERFNFIGHLGKIPRVTGGKALLRFFLLPGVISD